MLEVGLVQLAVGVGPAPVQLDLLCFPVRRCA